MFWMEGGDFCGFVGDLSKFLVDSRKSGWCGAVWVEIDDMFFAILVARL